VAAASSIVYIEDNAANLDLVRRVLEATGKYRVIGVEDGKEGLAVVRRERPALVLVDLDIPSMNGFEITRQLRHDGDAVIAATPVVAISANVLQGESEAAINAGCNAFVEKPFDIHAFREVIASVLEAAASPG
jgi:two-component system cell cycle response regulator DivK